MYDWGIDICAGQLNRINLEDKEAYHLEKREILRVGLKVSSYINTDDTGARHQGVNSYCTHIGNDWFAWFETTPRKNRINFLELLRGERRDYVLSVEKVQGEIWDFYQDLKAYKKLTAREQQQEKAKLEQRFDQIFTTNSSFETLNQVLVRLNRRKRELLKVLDKPELPLHNG